MPTLRPAVPLLVRVLTVLLLIALFGVLAAGIFLVYPLGHEWAVMTAVALLLAWMVLGPRLRRGRVTDATTRFRRILGHVKKPVAAALVCWFALLGWSKLSPGGPMPAAKADPASIRVVTWNIHCGEDGGPVWQRFNWSERKHALEAALLQAAPDILCVQEAREEQVTFLEKALPTHRRVGVGRDDGRSAGEFCAIYFNRDRFEALGSGTFWLEEPTDVPGSSPLHYKRICSWVRLRDQANGRTLRVYNTHLYLTEQARQSSARLIRAQIESGDPADAVILCGDFNAPPTSPTGRILADAGLVNSAEMAGKPTGTPTYQYYGIRLRCLDGILVSPRWQVRHHHVLDVKPHNTFPSDHFGVLTDLAFSQ